MSQQPDESLDAVLMLVNSVSENRNKIPFATIQRWMYAKDPEIQGTAADILLEHQDLIQNPPADESVNNFLLTYLERALRDNPQGQYVHTRYGAGYAIRAWFETLWRESGASHPLLASLRDLLAVMGRGGDSEMQNAIVTSVLEHLFRQPQIVEFFKEWQYEPTLAQMYMDALHMAEDD